MGKSHIGLTYSQEINEILDKLANMVNICPFVYSVNLTGNAYFYGSINSCNFPESFLKRTA